MNEFLLLSMVHHHLSELTKATLRQGQAGSKKEVKRSAARRDRAVRSGVYRRLTDSLHRFSIDGGPISMRFTPILTLPKRTRRYVTAPCSILLIVLLVGCRNFFV